MNVWFFFLLLLVPLAMQGQLAFDVPIRLKWNGVQEERISYDTLLIISLEGGLYHSPMPEYHHSLPIYDDAVRASVEWHNVSALPLSEEELKIAENYLYNNDFECIANPIRSRDEALLSMRIIPFRQVGGKYEKLVSATLKVRLEPDLERAQKSVRSYAHTSAMASGNWYKIGLSETGIHKLTYNDLSDLGIDVANLDPRQLRIYHNGGGVLPELNAEPRHDDLKQLPIYVSGEADGSFDRDDYVLFYGRGPVTWNYNSVRNAFEHLQNPYDDYAYAFVVTGLGQGDRITEANPISATTENIITEFIDYQVYESDEFNLNRTGRTYYGDMMDGTVSREFNFSFPNVNTARVCQVKTELAGRNYKSASFEVYVDDVRKAIYSIHTTESTSTNYGHEVGGWVTSTPLNETVCVKLKHNSAGDGSVSHGYVDYILVNAWRKLKLVGAQMPFRNPDAYIINKVYEYRLEGASSQVQVWDVTDPVAPKVAKGQLNGSTFSFKAYGNRNNAFIAFNGSSYCSAKMFGKVNNQNLHGIRDVDYLILTYPDFMEQAERVKAIHASIDPDLNVYITTPELIYNEFSCGAKDITAIRDFCRMLYLDSNPGRRIKYLLLLGDASYDYKNRNGVVDFVPAFESVLSLQMSYTFVTDDYYGFMDENEGSLSGSIADIGIGRFPVSTAEQASQMVDKIERYIVKDASTMQPWRNMVTFFADDEGGFVSNSEELASDLKYVKGEHVMIDKIYLDAYPQINSPGGEIAPEMNVAINNRMEKGTLVLNYLGHGGEVQLAEERILQKKDVDSWRNAPMYPLMITGTCEFSRYDDHKRTSLGEYAFLNPYGGMIAMFTTSRITYGDNNKAFCRGVYENLFRIQGGEHYRLGDVYRMAKRSGSKEEKRYVFFGDPALRLAYPKWEVETVSINGNAPGFDLDSIQINDSTWETYFIYHDTISALQPVEIEGIVKDLDGRLASGFNGVVQVTVYDKEAELTTNGTTGAGVIPFKLRNSVIFNGKTDVENGRFKVKFVVPRDIAYRYGQGLISYYATDYEVDANGSCDAFIIGGFYDDAIADQEAPDIRLFIDDTLFVSGGITGDNPIMLAFIKDESGINTTGTGIGHDIIATLEGPSGTEYCLNDYFVSELNDPGKGSITFKMQDLADGDYVLNLKVWDIYNNSNIASIGFTVVNSGGMKIEHLFNTPNPMGDETRFVFDHNQVGNNMKVDIHVFDVMGRWVTTISDIVAGTTARSTPILWNGCGARGERLRNGIYIYRIVATNDQGETDSAVSKLIICK